MLDRFAPSAFLFTIATLASSLVTLTLIYFIARPDPSDDLARFRMGTEFGCYSMTYRKSPVLFLGDSHAYASLDYLELSRHLSPLKVGGCGVGGLYFETFIQILQTLEVHDALPKVLVYVSSLRQFTVSRNKALQSEVHRKLLTNLRSRYPLWQDLQDRFDHAEEGLQKRILGLQIHPTEQQRLDFESQKANIDKMTEESSIWLMNSIPNVSSRSWEESIRDASSDVSFYRSEIQELCKLVRLHGIQLIVADVPESPALAERYKEAQKKVYSDLLSDLGSCAKKVVLAKDAGSIGNRHFLDRYLDPKFPYEAISNQDMAGIEHFNPGHLYDLDHMNLVGAHLYSNFLGEEVKKQIAGADGNAL